jgi:indolepyruvate ferredoxin oxidoreductase beta subunit
MITEPSRKRLTVAILAIGGQGGGVLADWIVQLGAHNGCFAQGTSVPGVAQRTGSTIYYIELFPDSGLGTGHDPILALAPAPGDVDIVIASELMEAGRAMVRGFVSADRTTLIASSHRVYSIGEKSALGDGRSDSGKVLEAAGIRSRRLIQFDMEAVAERAGSVISSVLFGALCASRALPFTQDQFEVAIRDSGVAVAANLAGFRAGMEGAEVTAPEQPAHVSVTPAPTTEAGRVLAGRVEKDLPLKAQRLALEGVRRLMDYQDARYAALYLDRLSVVRMLDDGRDDFELTAELARHLALWMSYEDTIRVADLKTRGSRFDRVLTEIRATPDQLVNVTEFMSPRLREVCETMPVSLGRAVLESRFLSSMIAPFVGRGRHVTTTGIGWFLAMRALAGLRRWRPGTLRYHEEQARIENWLALIGEAARSEGSEVALELVRCQRLVKGYGDTHARGLASYHAVLDAYRRASERTGLAGMLRRLGEAALLDEYGTALGSAVGDLALSEVPATTPPERAQEFRIERRQAS